MTASSYTVKGLRWTRTARGRVWAPIDTFGFVLGFCWQVLASIPLVLKHYRAQTMTLITDMTWGRGAVIVGGGTAAVMGIMGVAVGVTTGIESYSALDLVSLGQLTGVVSAFANTRELAPIAAGIGFAAQAGCRMTAEIGSMRIAEEIDAIESLGVRSVPFVVTTRVIAGLVAIVPTFLIALILSYVASAAIVVRLHGEPSGVYDHYFDMFVVGWDIAAAVIKVMVFAVAVIVIHCYQGFFATGGPQGVGIASGRAIRASLVAIIALNMVMTMLLWGFTAPVRFAG
ncbi:ABC transporter permease [Nocardia gipuzkoensis]|uniref:ABC transporter permease n=1 Tax=Nocardia gipuzkoensis TaxID=2749991 RepID=UPI001E5BC624|nr:ABC transporter permease [Nocardia gipuzkoensis]UGT71296.1 ABC transporter permease [Nocardia gipuzkoensis]